MINGLELLRPGLNAYGVPIDTDVATVITDESFEPGDLIEALLMGEDEEDRICGHCDPPNICKDCQKWGYYIMADPSP